MLCFLLKTTLILFSLRIFILVYNPSNLSNLSKEVRNEDIPAQICCRPFSVREAIDTLLYSIKRDGTWYGWKWASAFCLRMWDRNVMGGLCYGSCGKREGIWIFSRMHWVLFVPYCSVFSSADSILLHWNHLSNSSAYKTHMQLIAAAWQEPGKAREQNRSLRLPLMNTAGILQLRPCQHLVTMVMSWSGVDTQSFDVRPAVCFPVLLKGLLGSSIMLLQFHIHLADDFRRKHQLNLVRIPFGCCQSNSKGVQPSHRDTLISELL